MEDAQTHRLGWQFGVGFEVLVLYAGMLKPTSHQHL